jgi:hypothetical protein
MMDAFEATIGRLVDGTSTYSAIFAAMRAYRRTHMTTSMMVVLGYKPHVKVLTTRRFCFTRQPWSLRGQKAI